MLMDQCGWDSFPAGTVGAAYRDFVRSENFSAEGLAEISRRSRAEEVHPYAWFGRRMRDSHDIWHVLTGYHRDGLGEACLVAFSYAQTRGLGWALIALGAGLSALKERSWRHARAIWQGYQRGKAAKWLPAEDYVQLLSEPLDAARQRLNITPATMYDAIPFAERARGRSANPPVSASQRRVKRRRLYYTPVATSEPDYDRHLPSDRPRASNFSFWSVVPTLFFDIAMPLLVFDVLSARGVPAIWALAAGGLSPALNNLRIWVRSRRLEPLGIIVMTLLAIGTLTSLISGNVFFALIKDSFLTGTFGLICLVSLVAKRPLMFSVLRQFVAGEDPCGSRSGTIAGKIYRSAWRRAS